MRKCKNYPKCTQELTPPIRADAIFCSDNCRKAYHIRVKRKEERLQIKITKEIYESLVEKNEEENQITNYNENIDKFDTHNFIIRDGWFGASYYGNDEWKSKQIKELLKLYDKIIEKNEKIIFKKQEENGELNKKIDNLKNLNYE